MKYTLNFAVFILIIIGLVITSASSAYSQESDMGIQILQRKQNLSVAFVGDSLTNGEDASSIKTTYPTQFISLLGTKVNSSKVAFSGITTGSMLDKFNTDPKLIPKNQNIVIVELGTNDYFLHTSVKDFISSYNSLINLLRTNSPHAKFICLTTWQTDINNPYNKMIVDNCPGLIADINPLFKNKAFHGPAGTPTINGKRGTFHPNDIGYRAIADTILSVFTMDENSITTFPIEY